MAKYQEWLEEQNLKKVEYWAMCGLSDEQIFGDKMHVGKTTFYSWVKRFPNFADAIKKGREAPAEIANSLKNVCMGFYVYEEEAIQNPDGTFRKKKIKRYIPPNTTAIIYALNNRDPDNWSNKHREEADNSQLQRLDDILAEIRKDAQRSTDDNALHD